MLPGFPFCPQTRRIPGFSFELEGYMFVRSAVPYVSRSQFSKTNCIMMDYPSPLLFLWLLHVLKSPQQQSDLRKKNENEDNIVSLKSCWVFFFIRQNQCEHYGVLELRKSSRLSSVSLPLRNVAPGFTLNMSSSSSEHALWSSPPHTSHRLELILKMSQLMLIYINR